jgi:hypothetical protein
VHVAANWHLPKLSVSRFNRRLHALQDVLLIIVSVLGEMLATGPVFVFDAMPVPECKRVRAERCRKAPGTIFWAFVRINLTTILVGSCIWCVMRLVFRSLSSCCPLNWTN